MKIACKYHKDSSTIALHFPGKFGSTNLSDRSITTAKLANGAVTTLKIVDDAIEAVKLATASITSEKVATAAIGSSHLQDALVTTAKIANLAVDASRLADLTITAGKLASSCVEASKIANLAVGAAAIASGAIGTAKIADAAILAAKIDNAAVTSAKIYDAAIVSAKIADLAVIEAKIGNLAVNTAKIASFAINTAKIASLAVTTAKIADLAVNNAKISNLDAAKINTGFLNAARIEAGSIVLSKITGLGGLATEDNLDDVPNGTTYSRVLTTALDGGKIVLSSSGCTGTLPTSLTIAKCTDANADQTSAHGQNLGWLIGSTGELTISSGGKLKLNCADALEIQAAGNIKVLAGGDIDMYGHATNPALIKFYDPGATFIGQFGSDATAFLRLLPPATGTKTVEIGTTSLRWNDVNITANSVKIQGYHSASDYCYVLCEGGTSPKIKIATRDDAIGVIRTIEMFAPDFYPTADKTLNLGRALAAWNDAYADDWHNVADFYNFDIHDDLAVLNQIKGSGTIQEHSGYELIDDSTLPLWLLSKHKKDGSIMYNPEGKPYLSLKACISLCWGAIRQLDKKIEVTNEKNIN